MRKHEVEVRSATGEMMRALWEVEPDGSFSVVTADKHGYASAHLRLARKALGGQLKKVIDHSWVASNGVKARLSVYRLAV